MSRIVEVSCFFTNQPDYPQLQIPAHVQAELGPDFIVFNAPRPLYGMEWRGEFRHGVFYAAVDLRNEWATTWIKSNLSLDASVCVQLPDAVLDARFAEIVRDLEAKHGYKVDIDDFEWPQRWDSIHLRMGKLYYDGDPFALLAAMRVLERTGVLPATERVPA